MTKLQLIFRHRRRVRRLKKMAYWLVNERLYHPTLSQEYEALREAEFAISGTLYILTH